MILILAKYNAEMNYAVIGTQEDIKSSLCVMEHYVPLFFKGAMKIYKNMGKNNNKRVTKNKQQISRSAREILKHNMTLEYEFYEFVKQRLNIQIEYLRKKLYPKCLCSE